MADRFVLAVKDRNIRMLYLNAEARRDPGRAELTHTLDNVYKGLVGADGAIDRIEKAGFRIGQAEPFDYPNPSWARPLKPSSLLGGIALIALTLGAFVPALSGRSLRHRLCQERQCSISYRPCCSSSIALGAAVCAPTLAVMWAIRTGAHDTEETAAGRVWLYALYGDAAFGDGYFDGHRRARLVPGS